MQPGSYYVVITTEGPRDGIQARQLGLELRDTLAILMPGQTLHALLLRAPMNKKTVAAQVLATGTGAINIDACRISAVSEDVRGLRRTQGSPESFYKQDGRHQNSAWGRHQNTGRSSTGSDLGRWPTNVLLVHGLQCVCTGTKRVSPGNGSGKVGRHTSAGAGATPNITDSDRSDFEKSVENYVGDDGKETVADWDCQPNCPVKLLDEQSGDLQPPGGNKYTTHKDGMFGIGAPGKNYFDSGGASRFFPQFESLSQAAIWLHQLITPN